MPVIYDNGITDYGVVDHPQQLRDGGAASGVYKFNTPDGGVQNGYYLSCSGASQGGDLGWVLIGRYPADASSTVTNNMNSTRGLSDVSTNGTQFWSADWGNSYPEEIRFLGHTNASDIMGNRTIDWIYRCQNINQAGEGTRRPKLWQWFQNANYDDLFTSDSVTFRNTAINSSKQGVRVAGARDGRGRWDNKNLKAIRISDNSTNNFMMPAGFTSPTNAMWGYHYAQDAKWAVSASDHDCGQDTDSSALFGYDDNNRAFYDDNTGHVNDNSNRRDFSSCVLVFMR